MSELLLETRNLTKYFPVTRGIVFAKQVGAVQAVDGVSFAIRSGETFGLVGESGCGKTTTAKLILMLESITNGHIYFKGQDINSFSAAEMKNYHSSVQAVFQNPYGSLSPRMRIGRIIAEPLIVNNNHNRETLREKIRNALSIVGLNPDSADNYPHEFSGGQRQRIAIARALALNPSLIVLDEPVSALDVSIRAQIMNLLQDIQEEYGPTYLLIAHDLAVVKHMSGRIGVMYLGKLVEVADSDELFDDPRHPYTRALHSAALPAHPDLQREEIVLPGEVPSPLNPPSGCRFHPRCPDMKSVCSEIEPDLVDLGNDHQVACHLNGP